MLGKLEFVRVHIDLAGSCSGLEAARSYAPLASLRTLVCKYEHRPSGHPPKLQSSPNQASTTLSEIKKRQVSHLSTLFWKVELFHNKSRFDNMG